MDEEDELSEVQPDTVPTEVREWLASTFTRSNVQQKRRSEDKPKFRSVAHAIRAGIMVDRIYRRFAGATELHISSEAAQVLKGADEWYFDVFALNETCKGQVLRCMSADLLNRYGLIHKFKIPSFKLENFLKQIELGYTKYSNPYHNNLHAADVTQTVHYMLLTTGLAQWLTDLEIFATLIAAIIHDYQHTGTTNNFHVMSGSEITMIYNDRSVLENFHISAAFKVIRENDSNIVVNLSKEEYREFRSLVIDMVLATDMSSHFLQIKTLKTLLGHTEFNIDKPKGLSYILHSADISHPSKSFDLHYRWTKLLMEEFFRQGDMESELGLPYSPLCDRNTTLIPQSQIGFIDFIVAPTMELCGDLIDRVNLHIHGSQEVVDKKDSNIHLELKTRARPVSANCQRSSQKNNLSLASGTDLTSNCRSSTSAPLASRNAATIIKPLKTHRPWIQCLEDNKNNWTERAGEETIKSEQSLRGNGDSTPESEL
ncbi:dual specificity calcium/calmodulin-dependent 3',5'-cyclic nucleotide phosphodiesterase 1-like [Oppia nitens]|uniref:dual specificity calcium/calmodulin-dependent 3',5'-cyclic nucleotide phosphodiesterase 1-like n=1 Tax=Oppia nitens TaxID=1686743 RepID=UPI0023DB2ECF|nr:dual specificity calcium/calmodulin-dependent 3',5'-cyclic nucleotide phosphodiesterase 1-like [Oppia nitens]XP_054168088.1 dual specificity calcium/calmodulin-dependent 3',5'-cyclic nucleotide phosphodiesterase 1-like [Oppia nitens]